MTAAIVACSLVAAAGLWVLAAVRAARRVDIRPRGR